MVMTGDVVMVDERDVVAALERFVLDEGDRVESARTFLDGFRVRTDWTWYQVMPADWRIARAPWITTALRVTEDPPVPTRVVEGYGWTDPALLTPPEVARVGATPTIDVTSIHHHGHTTPPAVDVLQWSLPAERGRKPTWSRTYRVQDLQMP